MSKLANYAGQGTDDIQDTKTPYLKIAQPLTDETMKAKPNYIEGLEAGMFFCPTTRKIFGTEIDVIVLATRKAYFLSDRDKNFKGVVEEYDNSWERDAQGLLITREGYRVNLTYSFLVVTPDNINEPMVFMMKSSDTAAARIWNTMLKQQKLEDGKTACPIFGGVWHLTPVFRENDKGSWYAIGANNGANIAFNGFVPDELVDQLAEASATSIQALKTQSQQALERRNEPKQIESNVDTPIDEAATKIPF